MNRSNRKFSRSLRKRFYREINDFRTPSDGVVFLVSTSLPQLYHAAIQANIFQKVPFFTLLSDNLPTWTLNMTLLVRRII